ncbi:hypothetical protein FG93_04630 [Bosea sp. LC85]|nr:hypothetical protein FG93_04630 [Bosea sp. LC85]
MRLKSEADTAGSRTAVENRDTDGKYAAPGAAHAFHVYDTRLIPGGCHVPSPAGRIDGGVGFGQ